MKSIERNAPSGGADTAGPTDPELGRLAGLIRAHAPYDGSFELAIPGVYAIRSSRTNKELVHVLQRPALCIVTQGAKRVMLGREVYEYGTSRMIVFSVDLPVAGQVTRASLSKPSLCFRLDIDPRRIAELVLKVYPHGPPRTPTRRAVYVAPADAHMFNAATRLVELAAHPGEARLLAPLVIDEILIRLLLSPAGGMAARIGLTDSCVQGVARAVAWLRDNFCRTMRVEDLADVAHMSLSSFHHHFRNATSMSPLQYQKVLRLQEARRLMLSSGIDAGTASRDVGYQSASQFSREYSRFFGSAPTRDIARLRKQGFSAEDVSR